MNGEDTGYTYYGVKTSCITLIPEVIEVTFEIRGDYIHVRKGAVTGYENCDIRKLMREYPESSMFSSWVACMGTLRKYPRLEIPVHEIVRYLWNSGLVNVISEYGYIKNIEWKGEPE